MAPPSSPTGLSLHYSSDFASLMSPLTPREEGICMSQCPRFIGQIVHQLSVLKTFGKHPWPPTSMQMPGPTFCLPLASTQWKPASPLLPSSLPVLPLRHLLLKQKLSCVFLFRFPLFCSVILKVGVSCLFLNECHFKILLLKNQQLNLFIKHIMIS